MTRKKLVEVYLKLGNKNKSILGENKRRWGNKGKVKIINHGVPMKTRMKMK